MTECLPLLLKWNIFLSLKIHIHSHVETCVLSPLGVVVILGWASEGFWHRSVHAGWKGARDGVADKRVARLALTTWRIGCFCELVFLPQSFLFSFLFAHFISTQIASLTFQSSHDSHIIGSVIIFFYYKLGGGFIIAVFHACFVTLVSTPRQVSHPSILSFEHFMRVFIFVLVALLKFVFNIFGFICLAVFYWGSFVLLSVVWVLFCEENCFLSVCLIMTVHNCFCFN